MTPMPTTVHASGGLVLRRVGTGWEVLAVHRPRYDDWSLPKGKDEPGESPAETALREVWEETGVRGRIIAPLDEVAYTLADGRDKVVRYFAMTVDSARPFSPNDEVDAIRWLPAGEAARLLTYPHDAALVDAVTVGAVTRPRTIHLLRHGAAGSRGRWTGDDRLRPLSPRGERQAEKVAAALVDAGIDRILSSPYTRCRQTVEPLAAELAIEIEEVEALAEGAPLDDALALLTLVPRSTVLLCSHGDLIPALLAEAERCGADLGSGECRKGSVWTIDVDSGGRFQATYLAPSA